MAPLGYTMSNLVNAVIGVIIAMAVAFAVSFVLFGVWAKKGKLDPAELGIEEPEAAEELKAAPAAPVEIAAHGDEEIVAIASGEMIPPEKILDPMFAEEALGQTIAIEPTDGVIVSPANGVLELVAETGHAFAVRMADGTSLLIHVGIDTVNLKGDGFKVLKKLDDPVKAGEPVVEVDIQKVKDAGLSMQTMIIVSEPADEDVPVKYIDYGTVERGQRINK